MHSWRNLPTLTLTCGGSATCAGWTTKSLVSWTSSVALTKIKTAKWPDRSLLKAFSLQVSAKHAASQLYQPARCSFVTFHWLLNRISNQSSGDERSGGHIRQRRGRLHWLLWVCGCSASQQGCLQTTNRCWQNRRWGDMNSQATDF